MQGVTLELVFGTAGVAPAPPAGVPRLESLSDPAFR